MKKPLVDKHDHDNDIYNVQLEDQLDDLTAEIDQTNMTLASWKLRYYVEFLRLNGTKKYIDELQQQTLMRDEEITGLNAHIDNLVMQNQERSDYFAEEMTKQDGIAKLLGEHEEKVKVLHENLETFKMERALEAENSAREMEVLNKSLLVEREVNELARDEAARKQDEHNTAEREAQERYGAMESKLIGEIDATHDQYKKQMREKEDEHKKQVVALEALLDKMNEENIFLSSKSAAAELAKTEILSKYAEAESQREICDADLKAMTSKFERVSSELEKRDQQYGDESMQLQVLRAEADRLKAEYQRKDLVITDMKSELGASQDDCRRISQDLVASRSSNQEKADLVGQKEALLEGHERDFKLRVQTLQNEHAASMQVAEDKLHAIAVEHEKQVLLLEGRISEMQASQTMRFLNFALAEQEKEARIRREAEEEKQRLKEEMEHKLMLEHKERERAEAEVRESQKAAARIQAIIRGNQGRNNNKETLEVLKESRQKILRRKKEMRATVVLQKQARMILAKRHMAILVQEVARRNDSARQIQAVARGFLLRQQLQANIPMLETEMDTVREHTASTKIQSHFRRRQGQRELKRIRDEQLRQQMIEHEVHQKREMHGASTKIQRMWRHKRAPDSVRDASADAARQMYDEKDILRSLAIPFSGSERASSFAGSRPSTSQTTASSRMAPLPIPENGSHGVSPLASPSPSQKSDTGSARTPVSPKFGVRMTADSAHMDSVKNMSDNESRVELLRARQQINGLQEMITEVSWRYRQAEVTIESLQDTAAQNEAHINDLVRQLDDKNAHIDMREEDLRELRELLEEMTRVGEEVQRQGECSLMHNEELEQQLTEFKDRNFHTLGYSRFLEEQLFEARKLQKQILEGKGGIAGRDGAFDGTDEGENNIPMTVSKGRAGRGRRGTRAEGGSPSPRTAKKGTTGGVDEDFASLFNGGPGDSPAASDASSTLDSPRPPSSVENGSAGGLEEDEDTLVLGASKGKAKKKNTPHGKSTSNVNPTRGDDDMIKTVTLSELLGKLTEEDADEDRSQSGSSDSDSDGRSGDVDEDEETKAERERDQKKIRDALHAITANKAENTATDIALEELKKQQRALKEYSYRQEEFDKEMSVQKLVDKLKKKLDEAEMVLKLKADKIEELQFTNQALGRNRAELEEEVAVRFKELMMVREKPATEAVEKFLSEREAKKRRSKKYDTMAAWMHSEASSALSAGSPFALLNLLLNEVNKDSYFGGAREQLHEVVQVSFDAKKGLDDTASEIQAFLDDEVAPSITRKQLARREVQKWLDTFYDLCGREPSISDKKSSVHFSLIADNYTGAQKEVEATIARARGMALIAEQRRYIYEACAHFIFHLTGRRPEPFRFRFMIPDERWSSMEDPIDVGRAGFEDVHEYSCVIVSLISPSLENYVGLTAAPDPTPVKKTHHREREKEILSPTGSSNDSHSESSSNHSDDEHEHDHDLEHGDQRNHKASGEEVEESKSGSEGHANVKKKKKNGKRKKKQ